MTAAVPGQGAAGRTHRHHHRRRRHRSLWHRLRRGDLRKALTLLVAGLLGALLLWYVLRRLDAPAGWPA